MTVPHCPPAPVPVVFTDVPGFAYYTAQPVEDALPMRAASPAQEALEQLFGYYAPV